MGLFSRLKEQFGAVGTLAKENIFRKTGKDITMGLRSQQSLPQKAGIFGANILDIFSRRIKKNKGNIPLSTYDKMMPAAKTVGGALGEQFRATKEIISGGGLPVSPQYRPAITSGGQRADLTPRPELQPEPQPTQQYRSSGGGASPQPVPTFDPITGKTFDLLPGQELPKKIDVGPGIVSRSGVGSGVVGGAGGGGSAGTGLLGGVAGGLALPTTVPESEKEKNKRKNEMIEAARQKLREQGIFQPIFFGEDIDTLSAWSNGKPVIERGKLGEFTGIKPPTPGRALDIDTSIIPSDVVGEATARPKTAADIQRLAQSGSISSKEVIDLSRGAITDIQNQIKNALKSEQPFTPENAQKLQDQLFNFKTLLKNTNEQLLALPEDPMPTDETLAGDNPDILNTIKSKPLAEKEDIFRKYQIPERIKEIENMRAEILAEMESAFEVIKDIQEDPDFPKSLANRRAGMIERAANTNIAAIQAKLGFLMDAYNMSLDQAKMDLGIVQDERARQENALKQQQKDNQSLLNQMISSGGISVLDDASLEKWADATGYNINDLKAIAEAKKVKAEGEVVGGGDIGELGIVETTDGEKININTIAGIKYLQKISKEKFGEEYTYGELFAWYDNPENSKLTKTAIEQLLADAGVEKPEYKKDEEKTLESMILGVQPPEKSFSIWHPSTWFK